MLVYSRVLRLEIQILEVGEKHIPPSDNGRFPESDHLADIN